MSQHVNVYRSDSSTYRLVRGPLRRWLIEHSIPGMWSPQRRGFHVRAERVADIVAMLEAEGFRVHLHDREAPR